MMQEDVPGKRSSSSSRLTLARCIISSVVSLFVVAYVGYLQLQISAMQRDIDDLKVIQDYSRTGGQNVGRSVDRTISSASGSKMMEELTAIINRGQGKHQINRREVDDTATEAEDVQVVVNNAEYARRGRPGPPGPPGPRGPQGPPGLGMYPAQIVASDMSASANQSGTVTLTCAAFGNPLSTIEWRSNARNTSVSVETNNETMVVKSTIKIDDIGWADRGQVECHSRNFFGQDKACGKLTVFAAPNIVLVPQIAEANIGSTAVLPKCVVASEPKARITWKKGYGVQKEGAKTINDSLVLPNVEWEDSGFYICEAENYLGKASASVLLRIRDLEFAETPPVVWDLNATATVSLNCSATGPAKFGQQMQATWLQEGGLPLNVSERLFVDREDYMIRAVIPNPRLGTAYECRISDGPAEIQTEYSFFPTVKCGQGAGMTQYSYYQYNAGNATSEVECFKKCLDVKTWRNPYGSRQMNGFTLQKQKSRAVKRYSFRESKATSAPYRPIVNNNGNINGNKICVCNYGMKGRTSPYQDTSCYF